jgi:YVTN family beta-propeller protein
MLCGHTYFGTLPRRLPQAMLALFASAFLLVALPSVAGAVPFLNPPGTGPTALVGANPIADVADPATHTLYVANGAGTTVSVIGTAHCNASDASGCGDPVATVNAGPGPFGLALDRANHTLYITDSSSDTVAMLDVSACNAMHPSGCGLTPLTAMVGSFPGFPAVDRMTNTIYVPNINSGTVSVIDGATCNAATVAGCGRTATVAAGSSATEAAVDDNTHTVYVDNWSDGTVSMINTATCSAADMACAETPTTIPVGPQPAALVLDRASNTVYVQESTSGGASLGSVAMINAHTCNADTTANCAPRLTPDGSGAIYITEDQATHTVYALNQEDMDISVIDAATCNAVDGAGCRSVPFALGIGGRTSVTPGIPDDGAGAVTVDPTTDTLYATSQSEDNVTVLNGATCNASDTSGCTRFAPTTTVGYEPQAIATDPGTHTAYVGNQGDRTVSVIDTRECNIAGGSCATSWPTVSVGEFPQAFAIDLATDTVYVANYLYKGRISVFDGATCNATNHIGCGLPAQRVSVGSLPDAIAVDAVSDTVYVANFNSNTVSVLDGAACASPAGCGDTLATIPVGNGPDGIAIDAADHTAYVTNAKDNTVSVIDTATCNAQTQATCGQVPTTVAVGKGPQQLVIDPATQTAYVADLNGSALSLIDIAKCNALMTSGCAAEAQSVPVQGLPWGIALDQDNGRIYIDSIWDSDMTWIDAGTCNAHELAGCAPKPLPARMGGWPSTIALDGQEQTGYVTDNVDGTVSMFPLGVG